MANNKGLIIDVDLRSHENNLAHRTREIDQERLIVRRGQPFSITLQFSDSFPPKHHLELVLQLDKVLIKVQKEHGAGAKWWFSQHAAQDEMLLTLHSPADAIIGQYHLAVLMMSPDGRIVERTDKNSFHLLFNPWCKDDAVYLPDESLLQEYVMNEDGIIYMGSWDNINSLPWNFGQFEDYVMDICFEVLDNSKEALKNSEMDIERRSDPVYVSRIITAMVNSNDDRGVLRGRWHEPYSDGVAPHRWTGSVPILQQWSEAGTSAVKYGQCWVFAGVTCTVLRCLGIPTRLITNFSSAHDVDGNLSLDFLLTESLEHIDGKDRQDSSWNFHCWVESWMRRDDLPKANDGWQVLDSTPQERSDGEFCCGPCPVTAIKEGNLGIKYDAPFVFAEVNADIIYWIVKQNGQRQKIRVDQESVGKNISTKSVHGDHREDVTLHYKYPEGSKKEREVYEKAGHRLTVLTNKKAEPGQLQLSIKHAKPVFGTDFDVIVKVRNEGGRDTHAQLTMVAMAVTYNSLHLEECKRQTVSVTVPAHKAHKEVLRLHYDDYVKCVSEHHLIRVKALLKAPEENEPIMTIANISLSLPEVLVQVPGRVTVQKQVTAYFSFTNPLPVPLKGGVFTVEGAGLLSATKINVNGDILPGQKVSAKLSFSPMRAGVRKLLVDFDSDRLKNVKGHATVVVHKK
ncbi:protein-glutamine gamma-glutamyltransferase 2 [Micropterus salmoides]|uniref:protein-glutamine gamma-glutamyltransferase 2 n=1 Tax=Micropterus salmoides TaxID=27706 RepID=UPI0018EBCBC5|nr:protein-glutamine gamma-glutamyltransferase 2 [Micropterus salmoides]